jgi:hypothetical protein
MGPSSPFTGFGQYPSRRKGARELLVQFLRVLTEKYGADALPAPANQNRATDRLSNGISDLAFDSAARRTKIVFERGDGTGFHDVSLRS